MKSFQALRAFADFSESDSAALDGSSDDVQLSTVGPGHAHQAALGGSGEINPGNVVLNLACTINLNLPESTNPEVFNQIFRALRAQLISHGKS